MSVDFYGCDCCGESRYEEFVGECSKCGHSLCTQCLINKDINSSYAHHYGVKFDGTQEMADEYGIRIDDYEEDEVIDDVGIDSKHCPFCNGNRVHNDDLLDFALSLLRKTKDTLTKEYVNSKK